MTTNTLTFYQRHVLLALAQRGASPATDWGAWYPMREDQVRGVIRGLANRGLVDVAGFTSTGRIARTFGLTDKGWAAVENLDEEEATA